MAENEKKQNKPAAENNTQKPEKKMTKYDLKMQRRREEELRQQKRRKQSIGIIALIVIVCAGVFAWQFYGSYQEKNGEYVAIGEHSVKKAEYDYYFYSGVNSFAASYGSYMSLFGLDLSQPLNQQSYSDTMTWQDYFDQQAVDQLQRVYALSDEASEQGFEHDATENYNTFAESVKANAESQEMDVDEYCKSLYGSYATLEGVKPYIERSSLAAAYYDSIEDATEVTEDEINTYYAENKADYDSVDYLLCKVAADMPEEETEADETAAVETTDSSASETNATETAETMSEEEKAAAEAEKQAAEEAAMAEAKARADEMLGKVTDEASFDAVYGEYAEDASVASLNENIKKSSVVPTEAGEWLFDDARQAGDKTVIEYEAGNAYYVVYFIDRYLEHAKTVDVRHILVRTETTDETDAESGETAAETESEEDKAAAEEAAKSTAKAKAEDIYNEWKNGDATEDSFAELANTYSDDTGSNTNGGLYEAVKDGDMVANFNSWIFDAARKPGDTDIVETDYGYHIMYFVGDNDEEWHVSIENTLRSDKMNTYMTDLMVNYEVTDKHNHIAYLNVPETEAATETVNGETESGEGTEGTDTTADSAQSETIAETESKAE